MVFGLPLQMNGEEGEIAKEVRAFAEKLQKQPACRSFSGTKDYRHQPWKTF